MTFPSGVAFVTVTGQNIVDDGGSPQFGVIVFDPGAIQFSPTGIPPTMFENPVIADVQNGVMTPVKVPDSHHAQASNFTYTVTVKLEGRASVVYPGIVISIDTYPSGTVDIAQLL